jgi:hypothetical protein
MKASLFLIFRDDLTFTFICFLLSFGSIHFEYLLALNFSLISILDFQFIVFLACFTGLHHLFSFDFDKNQNLYFFPKVCCNHLHIFLFVLLTLIKNLPYVFVYFF